MSDRVSIGAARVVGAAIGLACTALLAAEVASGWHVLHSSEFFTALAAHKYVWANAIAAALVAASATFAPGRLRWLAIVGPALFLAGVLVATAFLGGQLLAMIMASLTMAAAWDTGDRLLRRLGADALTRPAIVAWLAGIAPWSLLVVVLGRVSLVKWWTVGLLVLGLGTTGLVRLCAHAYSRREGVARALGGSALSLTSCGLILLTIGWAGIYTAAPEIQYDALYGKAYLPELWARTGHISSILEHVQDAITGWFQILATSGHLFGAVAVGRYLQLIGLMCAVLAVWWWGQRHGALGPLAALAVALTPHLFWQASTADDDLLLALAALAFCFAIVESLRRQDTTRPGGLAFALGLMAGSGPSLKLHLLPLFAVLMLGWILAARGTGSLGRRFSFSALGAAITALPPLLLRWIDTGNPVLPAYNNIFRSKYWLPVNEKLNFPFWAHPGTLGPVKAVWKAVSEPSVMVEDAPPGAFGFLIGAVVIALVLGWLGRDRTHASRVIWIALIPAAVFWWISFRYLRYLLAIEFVSVALLVMRTGAVKLGSTARAVGVLAATIAAMASFPVAISQFWNVPTHKPPVYAAIAHWKASSYESAEFTERPAILAFNKIAPPGARMASDAFQRVWLTRERDLYNLHYEVLPLMQLHGIVPTTGDQALVGLARLGIHWLMVREGDRLQNEPGYISQVITAHGQPEFDERGWDLYRLVPRPRPFSPILRCDRTTGDVSGCWGVAATKHLTVSVTRTIATCPGEVLAVNVQQAPGQGAPSPVLIRFLGRSSPSALQTGEAVAGAPQHIYASVPPGATEAQITVSPAPGAVVTSANLARSGRNCG